MSSESVWHPGGSLLLICIQLLFNPAIEHMSAVSNPRTALQCTTTMIWPPEAEEAPPAGLRKNWDVPESFPNTAVIKAYREAKVDQNKDKFTYGRPDLQLLRRFCLDKFSWQQDRADELLVPVLKVPSSMPTLGLLVQAKGLMLWPLMT